jgi:hypothetical protein
MKLLMAGILFTLSFAAHAQSGANPNGANGSGAGQGRAFSNGNASSLYEQNQNRPDSSLRSKDTTYMNQQWNDGDAQKTQKQTKKHPASKHSSTSQTTTNKKKK